MHLKNIVKTIARQAAKFRLILAVMLLPLLLVGGCAPRTHGYKWVCTGTCSIPLHQADAKCTAQANAVLGASRFYKRDIQEDCLAGEGWERVSCPLAGDPDCE